MDSRKSEWGIHDFRRMVSPQICKEDKLCAHNTPVGERIRRERFPFGADEIPKTTPTTPPLSTFQVAILPSKEQRRVLQAMLRVSNVAYNWADLLVTKYHFRPTQNYLRDIVTRTTNEAVPATTRRKAQVAIPSEYVPDFARYVFLDRVGMSQHRLMAAVEYAGDYKTCLTKEEERKKKLIANKRKKEAFRVKYTVKRKPMCQNIPAGSFGVQKEYITQSTTYPCHLRVLYDMFGNTELKL
jgi:hypothetical protein